jgi:hypothetical protein
LWVNWLDLKGLSTEPGAAAYKNITVGAPVLDQRQTWPPFNPFRYQPH